jgi:alpha-beta hydrolase superfamily lysophospholipase
MRERTMKYEETEYLGYDDIEMFMRKWIPDDEIKGVILGIHGLGAHSGTISYVGEYFANNGYLFYAPDLRGFGHWMGEKGHIDSFDEYLMDIHRLIGTLRSQHMSNSLFLYGHSLGGMIVVLYLAKHHDSVDGAIAACPSVSERLELGMGTRIVAKLLATLNVKKRFSSGLNLDLISRNPNVVKRNKEDPLRYDEVTPRFGVEGLKAREKSALSGPSISTPILVIQTLEDQILIPEKTRVFFETIASEDKTFKEYPELYHEPFEEPGGEKVLEDFITWLDERTASHS